MKEGICQTLLPPHALGIFLGATGDLPTKKIISRVTSAGQRSNLDHPGYRRRPKPAGRSTSSNRGRGNSVERYAVFGPGRF